jgi:predicted nuclease with RNAse H fold
MKVLGIDLSGPGNSADTVCALFTERSEGLELIESLHGASDQDIVALAERLKGKEPCVVGLDAPLSYNPGGGDRPADRALRQKIMAQGLAAGSVMPPTLTRMVYLTLRGVTVARLLAEGGGAGLRIAEVHPGAALVLGGAPLASVKAFKNEPAARRQLLGWLSRQGLQQGVCSEADPSDHYVAACACALAAWKWARGDSAWRWSAAPPHHPYDFVC